ncbi:hypothetical protein K437DRAFT_251770 [Tilletiaria anomala UBC 951]|uniref:MHD domain-containing protein n=1 Tax=Tilletiaria anomala (strain ATCC 24038 / CBS 436.72 / UBC 951) TaxID=1037660 RepID=A0A066VFW2_TILAU|nr:uncharacterized protein K437DRAFT_251770 [Tilletiaria anomala UBC 951]KDN37659.1 hypothetical protein K437DRAFT_251770 [Tilletiaria anomala UBC 951]
MSSGGGAAAGGELVSSMYANAFVGGKPRESLQAIQTRLRKARVLKDELADYFAARREVEEAYLKGLAKVAKRSFLSDPSCMPPSFAPIYERLVGEIAEVANVHGELERKIATECEEAVRSAHNKGAWAAIRDYDDRLGNTVKELNSLEMQLSKDAKKLDSASGKKVSAAQQKVADTQRAIDDMQSLWVQDATQGFKIYQRIDKERLNLLKEVVAKFETASADAAQKLMGISEQTMQVCLSFDVNTDMQEFALREGNAHAVSARSARQSLAREGGGAGPGAPALPTQVSRSASNATARTNATSATRDGGVRRSDMPPPPLPAPRQSNTAGSGMPQSFNTSNSIAATEFAAVSGTGVASSSAASIHSIGQSSKRGAAGAITDTPTSTKSNGTGAGAGSGAGGSFKSAFSRFGLGRSGKDVGGSGGAGNTSTLYGTLNDEPDSSFIDAGATIKRSNTSAAQPRKKSMLDDDEPLFDLIGAGAGSGSASRSTSNGPPRLMDLPQPPKLSDVTEMNGSAAAGNGRLGNSTSAFSLNGSPAASTAPQVDSEGYSIPPPDRKPWEFGARVSSLMDGDGDDDVVSNLAASHRVSTMSINAAPVPQANSAEDQEALEKMRATLGAPKAAPIRRNTTSRRDRRDVRNTVYNPALGEESRPMSQFGLGALTIPERGDAAAAESSAAGSAHPSPLAATSTQSLFATKSGASSASRTADGRTQSMLSNVSSSRAAADPFTNTALGASGISTAITETVNVLFSGKELSKIMVVGEVGLSLKDVVSTEPLHIRVDAFEQLEKAAPNPAFLTAIYGRPGEYKLDVAALLAQGIGGTAQATVLKYQLYVSDDPIRRRRYLPLDVSAQWRCEDTQTSLLLSYSVNPDSKLCTASANSDEQEARLHGISFVVGITPSNVSSVMSKPSGTWIAESKKMQWALPDELSLGSTAASATVQKVLARFQVDAKSTPQPVGVRWTVRGKTLSALGISVVQDSTEAPSKVAIAETVRQCIAGKFLAGP